MYCDTDANLFILFGKLCYNLYRNGDLSIIVSRGDPCCDLGMFQAIITFQVNITLGETTKKSSFPQFCSDLTLL